MILQLAIGFCLSATVLAVRATNITADQQLVAAVLVAEAGGESDRRAMPAVLEVIRNRAKLHRMTLRETVLQYRQFSCLNDVTNLECWIERQQAHPRFETALKLVRRWKRTNVTHGALYYYSGDRMPGWAVNQKMTARIGQLKFFGELK